MQKGISTLVGIIIIIVVAVVSFGVVFTYQYFLTPKENNQQQKSIACTEEAKLCPDGSSVVRTGPNCEFATCPVVQNQTDQTADWKTYANSEGKFSLKYPSAWKFTIFSSNNDMMKTVIFTGNEGVVQVDYGQGFGGMCEQGYEKIQIGNEQFDACHYVGNGSMGEGFEQWNVSKEFNNNLGIGMFITVNKPHLSNRTTILKILSTFKFTK